MVCFFKCLCLCLIVFTHHCSADNRRLFKDTTPIDVTYSDFKIKQKEYAILNVNNHAQGQDNNIICQTAKCDYKSNTIYNVTSPECGNHYTCQECPASFGNDICYLGITSDGWVLVTEGSLQIVNNNRVYTNNSKPKEQKPEKQGYGDEYDEDEEAFLQLNNEGDDLFDYPGTSFVHKFVATQTFAYNDHHGEKWLAENKRQCQVDKEGNLDLSVRLIFQYFRSPLDVSSDTGQNANQEHYPDENMSALELSEASGAASASNSAGGTACGCSKKTSAAGATGGNGGVSLLQTAYFGGDEDDDGGDDDSEGGNLFSTAAKRGLKFSLRKGSELKKKLGNTIKFLYEKAQVMITKPEVHIHFVVDDIRIRNCRQPLSWAGEMSSGAMLFVANQNFKVRHDALTVDFLRKAVRAHASVRGIYDLAFNSCVQLHCTKSAPAALQYLTFPSQGKNFSISSKLMGYFNRPMPQPHPMQLIAGAPAPTHPLSTPVGPALGAPAFAGLGPPGAPVAAPGVPGPGGLPSAAALNGVSNAATIHLHGAPPKPDSQAAPPGGQPGPQSPSATPPKAQPDTNLPGFNGPAAHNLGLFGGIVQSEGSRTRFYIFVGVGILIILLMGYFFFK
ncbi:conserved hypothetical protein [Theileria orientalis strain Shintoku]|uniref:Uncharacterized protein n=1 Tax=Theileria orientalis strain Shintoku TaxID=869250 RepID=J4C7K7_THEOR|nr:conserved hypothetical protein [Theileria orientalis strain Shintoku]BAM39208.1 conserved hypothetical protein [Theileria orientalis strain Shintoku]|eukprot:XP_009689509.1 conserved hypothetical protein [Theileria orientalis strain Shintoku]